MARRRKSSRGSDPLDTIVDLAGAVTMGLYARHKIKKDFEKGQGEESAKAGSMVLGYGAMRGGSRGLISLGGLIGLNSGLKSIERQQQAPQIYEPPFIDNVSDAPKATSKKVRQNMWRERCEDGSAYGLSPYDFSSADDYGDALNKAKCASVADVSEVNILPTSDTVADSHKQKKNIWRKFCTDGSKYGVNPEDFENADDYEEALKRAKDKINS